MEHFSAVKFAMSYEKNMSFLVIAKSPKVWKKKVEKIGLGSFNTFNTLHVFSISAFWMQSVCLTNHALNLSAIWSTTTMHTIYKIASFLCASHLPTPFDTSLAPVFTCLRSALWVAIELFQLPLFAYGTTSQPCLAPLPLTPLS